MFAACPFSGILCTKCGRNRDSFRKSVSEQIYDHIRRHHQDDDELCGGSLSAVRRRKTLSDRVTNGFNIVARYHASMVLQQELDCLREFLLAFLARKNNVFFCSGCRKVFDKHRDRKRHTRLCDGGVDTRSYYLAIGSNECFIPLDFDVEADSTFSSIYLEKFLAAALDELRNDPPTDLVAFRQLANRYIPRNRRVLDADTEPDVNIVGPIAPVVAFQEFSPASVAINAFQGFTFPNPANDNSTNELSHLEMYAMKGAAQYDLIDFAMDLYQSTCSKHFGDDFGRMGRYMSQITAKASAEIPWQQVLSKAATHWFKKSLESLRFASPNLLLAITQVGTWEKSVTARRIKDKIREATLPDTNEIDAEKSKELLDFLVHWAVDDTSSRSAIGKLSTSSRAEYASEASRFCVFLGRRMLESNNVWFASVVPKLETYFHDPTDASFDEIIGIIQALIFQSLRLEDELLYEYMVTFCVSEMGLYCRARGIELKTGESVLFRLQSPHKTHKAASHCAYIARLCVVMGMLHAAKTGDQGLQGVLHGPDVLIRSSVACDIANIQRLCRSYEPRMGNDIPAAIPSKSTPDLETPDLFQIHHSETGEIITVSQQMIAKSTSSLISELQDMWMELLIAIERVSVTKVQNGQRVHLTVENDLEFIEISLLSQPIEFFDSGILKQFEEAKRGSDSTLWASTISCKFLVEKDDAQFVLESNTLADAIANVLEEEAVFRETVDAYHEQMLTILLH